MEANGFAPEYGTVTDGLAPLLDSGKLRAQRAKWEAQPVLMEAVDRLGTVVANERRADTVVPVRDLRMAADGRLHRVTGGDGLWLSLSALAPLLARSACPCPGAAAVYLREIPAARRAAEVNSWLSATGRDREVMLRHRTGRAGREAYAVVSPRYVDYDGDVLATALATALADVPGARGEIRYDGSRCDVRATWHAPEQPAGVRVGDTFGAVVGLRSADDGSGAVHTFGGLLRHLCSNMMLVSMREVSADSRRHVGRGMAADVARAIRAARESVTGLVAQWSRAEQAELFALTGVPGQGPRMLSSEALTRGVYRGLLASGDLSVPGERGASAVDLLWSCFLADVRDLGRPTVADLVNGITRAAHTAALPGVWAGPEVEAQAGAILAHATAQGAKLPFQAS